ncbi:hypothetical protein [Sphingobium phenoxybenzoativorans]|uniref:hypothetical protein n=1 Tax=Sphingobium phenoxybenzoativorans TaxID=1592790 RepID=UPI0009F6E61A|nr:hypothetical protein [Sphingobium phenoxybenzoativorans]
MSVPDTVPQPETEPGVATAEAGVVILEGPDGVAVTMTPDAATGTANSLLSAADTARTQTRHGDTST